MRCAPSGPQNLNPPYGSTSPFIGIVADGNYTPQAPKITADIGFDYGFVTDIGKWLISADYFYNDGYYTEPDNFLQQKSFEIINAQLKYSPTENLSVRVWGKNLSGFKYVVRATTQAGAAGYPYLPGPPRTYGLAVDFSF